MSLWQSDPLWERPPAHPNKTTTNAIEHDRLFRISNNNPRIPAMNKLTIALLAMLTALPSVSPAATPPKLEQGKDFIETPALGSGLFLPNLFQSDMVLQRDIPVPVWGWADQLHAPGNGGQRQGQDPDSEEHSHR